MIAMNMFFCKENNKVNTKEQQVAAILKEHVSKRLNGISAIIAKEMNLPEAPIKNEEQRLLITKHFWSLLNKKDKKALIETIFKKVTEHIAKYKEGLKKKEDNDVKFDENIPVKVADQINDLFILENSALQEEETLKAISEIMSLEDFISVYFIVFLVISAVLFIFSFFEIMKETNCMMAKGYDKIWVLTVIFIVPIIVFIWNMSFERFDLGFESCIDPEKIHNPTQSFERIKYSLPVSIFTSLVLIITIALYLRSNYFVNSKTQIEKKLSEYQTKGQSTYFLNFQKRLLLLPVLDLGIFSVYIVLLGLSINKISNSKGLKKFGEEYENLFAKILKMDQKEFRTTEETKTEEEVSSTKTQTSEEIDL